MTVFQVPPQYQADPSLYGKVIRAAVKKAGDVPPRDPQLPPDASQFYDLPDDSHTDAMDEWKAALLESLNAEIKYSENACGPEAVLWMLKLFGALQNNCDAGDINADPPSAALVNFLRNRDPSSESSLFHSLVQELREQTDIFRHALPPIEDVSEHFGRQIRSLRFLTMELATCTKCAPGTAGSFKVLEYVRNGALKLQDWMVDQYLNTCEGDGVNRVEALIQVFFAPASAGLGTSCSTCQGSMMRQKIVLDRMPVGLYLCVPESDDVGAASVPIIRNVRNSKFAYINGDGVVKKSKVKKLRGVAFSGSNHFHATAWLAKSPYQPSINDEGIVRPGWRRDSFLKAGGQSTGSAHKTVDELDGSAARLMFERKDRLVGALTEISQPRSVQRL